MPAAAMRQPLRAISAKGWPRKLGHRTLGLITVAAACIALTSYFFYIIRAEEFSRTGTALNSYVPAFRVDLSSISGGENRVGCNYPEDPPIKNPLHTLTVPRQRPCVSTANNPRQSSGLPTFRLLLASPTATPRAKSTRGEDGEPLQRNVGRARNHLLQSLYRTQYSSESVIQLQDSSSILSDEALSTVRQCPADSLVVVMSADAAALFTLPPEVLVSRFTAIGKRFLIAGNRNCDFCYCHASSDLPLRFLNASVAAPAEDMSPEFNRAAASPYLDSTFFMGYKDEVYNFIKSAQTMQDAMCLEERLAFSFLEMQAAGSAAVDHLSNVFGTVSPSKEAVNSKWKLGTLDGDRGISMLGYRHIPPEVLAREGNPRFPYPPIVLFSNILRDHRGCGCADYILQVYNDVCKVALGSAIAPYLLTPFRDTSIGIGAGRRKRFGGYVRPRIVVSLTTIPGRFRGVQDTLQSMLDQDIDVDAVYLHVPMMHGVRFGSASEALPDSVHELAKKFPRLIINRNCSDYGPATKLIPTLELELNPDTLIITVDDDMIFKRTAVRTLVRHHINSPDTVFSNAGQIIDFASDGPASSLGISVRSADLWKDGVYPIDILEAFMGAIYRRDFFDLEEMKRIPKECLYTDDIWVSANLAARGIPRVKLLVNQETRPTFSRNDNVNALRENNAPLACGIECSKKVSSEASLDEFEPNRNDICAKHLLLSHFFPNAGKNIHSTRIKMKSVSLSAGGSFSSMQNWPVGMTTPRNTSAGVRRMDKLHNVCPFEFTPLEPFSQGTQCDSSVLSDDINAQRDWLFRNVANPALGDPALLQRLRQLAAEVYRSACFFGHSTNPKLNTVPRLL